MHTIYMPDPLANHKIAGQQFSETKCSPVSREAEPRLSEPAFHAEEMSPALEAPSDPFQNQEQGGGMHFQIEARQ